jgi:hypothetical protein
MAYADPLVPRIHDEIEKYGVAIVPILPNLMPDLSAPGSGTCVRIGGRYFVATAAHVVQHKETETFFIGTPVRSNGVLRIINRGSRGGPQGEDLDVAWLELHPRAAAAAERNFLDVARMRTHASGDGETDLLVFGAPANEMVVGREDDGSPFFQPHASWWLARALMDPRDLGEAADFEKRMYLEWPRSRLGHNGETYPYPEAPGMSGGAVWAVNASAPSWRPENIQFVGVEYSWKTGGGAAYRFLRAFQAQVWLEMVADDLPELRRFIDPVLAAGRSTRLFRPAATP